MSEWFLSADERGNDATDLDRRHPDGAAWSAGNHVVPLIHGSVYFAELHRRIKDMRQGESVFFVDWRGDPDERLLGQPGSEVADVLASASRRGVDVRGLIWRSHLDRLQFSAAENRHLGEKINAAGGECHLDMRVRPGGSHHQKFVVLRHPNRPERDVAFVGGIDLGHSRRDDATHAGDPQRQPMAKVYGERPPWHDVQLMIVGPAVGDVEAVFRERWQDPQRLSRSPVRRLSDRLRRDQSAVPRPLPPQLPDPEARGELPVQLLRTYPDRRPGYDFAPTGERSVARGYSKAVARARRLIYLEDQYLWSRPVADTFAAALAANSELQMIAVLPHFPDQDGRMSLPPNLLGREQAVALLREAAGDRVAFYGLENRDGVPVYVHAKVCVIDDIWASVGSDNFNLRSWTHDSELSAAVYDANYARGLRTTLAREHLDGATDDELQASAVFATFAQSAARLQRWHDLGRTGNRPAGRLRPLEEPPLSWRTRTWSRPMYHATYDPDGRPRSLRRSRQF
jgi:phosphatidylserine/phosphatidylglycerophosphate/cardiolipin synthase-like enzyme